MLTRGFKFYVSTRRGDSSLGRKGEASEELHNTTLQTNNIAQYVEIFSIKVGCAGFHSQGSALKYQRDVLIAPFHRKQNLIARTFGTLSVRYQ